MKLYSVLLIALCLSAASIGADAQGKSTLKVAVHERTIKYFKDTVLPEVMAEVKKQLYATNFVDNLPKSKREYCIKIIGCFGIREIKASHVGLDVKNSDLKMRQEGLLIHISGISVHASGGGYWGSDPLTVKAGLSGASLSLGVQLGADKEGKPNVKVMFANLGLNSDNIYAKLSGINAVVDWAINKVVSWCRGLVTDQIQKKFKEKVVKTLNEKLGPVMTKIPMSHTIPAAVLNEMVPMTIKKGIEITGKVGHMATANNMLAVHVHLTPHVHGQQPDKVGCEARAYPDPTTSGKMLELHLAEFLPCRVTNTIYDLGALKWSGFVDSPALKLPTEGIAAKADGLINAIMKTYKVAYSVEASKAPTITFREKGGVTVKVDAPYTVWLVNKQTNKRHIAITSVFGIVGLVKTWIKGNTIYSKVEHVRPRIYQIKTFLREIDSVIKAPLQNLVEAVIEEKVMSKINAALGKASYPIPVVKGMTFVNPSIKIDDRHLVVNTDVSVDPKVILQK